MSDVRRIPRAPVPLWSALLVLGAAVAVVFSALADSEGHGAAAWLGALILGVLGPVIATVALGAPFFIVAVFPPLGVLWWVDRLARRNSLLADDSTGMWLQTDVGRRHVAFADLSEILIVQHGWGEKRVVLGGSARTAHGNQQIMGNHLRGRRIVMIDARGSELVDLKASGRAGRLLQARIIAAAQEWSSEQPRQIDVQPPKWLQRGGATLQHWTRRLREQLTNHAQAHAYRHVQLDLDALSRIAESRFAAADCRAAAAYVVLCASRTDLSEQAKSWINDQTPVMVVAMAWLACAKAVPIGLLRSRLAYLAAEDQAMLLRAMNNVDGVQLPAVGVSQQDSRSNRCLCRASAS